MRAVYNTPHEAFFVALFLTCRWICEILIASKPKRTKTPFTICMSAQPLPIGASGNGYRRYKDNTFILETTLFGWKSMILRSDLTLLNMNMSKNSTFAWFFLLKSLYYQGLLVSLHRLFPPSLSTMLKCVGLFCFYGYMATRIPFIKTYSTPHELVQLLKTRGMEFWILD